MKTPLLLIPIVLFSACAVGPDYRAAHPATAAAWSVPTSEPETVSGACWWMAFRDPALDALVRQALASNLDLTLAQARLREARALRGVADSANGPQVIAEGSALRQRSSENGPNAPFGGGIGNLYQVGFDATWEIDLFGGNRRASEAAGAELGAAVADWRAVQVSLAAEVVRVYLDLRGDDERLALARRAVDVQRAYRDLVAARVHAGLIDAQSLAQADAQLAQTEAAIPPLDGTRTQQRNRLAVLMGRPAGQAIVGLADAGRLPADLRDVLATGLPSELLRRRPDLQRAERELAAATARVGVATADWFPRFSLIGGFGYQSTASGELISQASEFWSLGPTVRWPILSAGRIRNQVRAADARATQAGIRYEQAVLAACAEVEDALTLLLRGRERTRLLTSAYEAQERSATLVRARQVGGVDDFLTVLRAERVALDAQDLVVQSRRGDALALVALAKALGDGWQDAIAGR